MRTDSAQSISRHDYRPYPYRITHADLQFDLQADATRVHTRLSVESADASGQALVLNGEDLTLEQVVLDGRTLSPDEYTLTENTLTLAPGTLPAFTLEITSLCRPADNTQLMGLYVSGNSLFTQCEAEGFRRITWFPDRPDVMSRYRVTLRADKQRYPLLLSNGNLLESRDLPDGRHEAVWEDPHPKPCYLFALVAGDFACREQTIQTRSGRDALLQVYSDHGSEHQTEWALDSLVRSVRWDETRFGLELDLDRFMIVAARDFNMGAMENKGLNVFNSAYVLADPESATDASYHAIEAVIGHEYFHNWTGNRVTCRDWFQLSLKEGLTVFRDQEFSADMMTHGLPEAEAQSARAVKRIDDVTALRIAQFPEDAGPMAHPIRPESYQSISNFYTATIYEKGAEIIRMQHTLLGEEGFRAGMDEYFRRHDGQAVTCDDFLSAMESVYVRQNPGSTLEQFRRWYSQAGTPRVKVTLAHDAAAQTLRVTLEQRNPPVGIETRQNPPVEKLPLHIPFALGLLDGEGKELSLTHKGVKQATALLELREKSQTWTFENIAEQPVPSLLRGFSAPVIVEYERTPQELALLARHDTDAFARWEAAQSLATRVLLDSISRPESGSPDEQLLIDTWEALLQDGSLTAAYRSRILSLPAERELLEKTSPLDPLAVVEARRRLIGKLGDALAPFWMTAYEDNRIDGPYAPDAASSGKRSMRNLALLYLMAAGGQGGQELTLEHYDAARNMTDRMAALGALVQYGTPEARSERLQHFYTQWRHNPLVIDRWFAVQAASAATSLADVRQLMTHPDFSLRNPNRARSLIFQFCTNNLRNVHSREGHSFWAEQVLALDALNPEISSRLARVFENWQRFTPVLRDSLQQAWRHIQSQPALSSNLSEIVNKALSAQ
ncbi:aminopeptidase N [Paracandidimonas soli]|uniref:aminopeptidase N n=1 Tax=Paracandidimonas soli TaxID=1917182 RepID=UPI00333FAD61